MEKSMDHGESDLRSVENLATFNCRYRKPARVVGAIFIAISSFGVLIIALGLSIVIFQGQGLAQYGSNFISITGTKLFLVIFCVGLIFVVIYLISSVCLFQATSASSVKIQSCLNKYNISFDRLYCVKYCMTVCCMIFQGVHDCKAAHKSRLLALSLYHISLSWCGPSYLRQGLVGSYTCCGSNHRLCFSTCWHHHCDNLSGRDETDFVTLTNSVSNYEVTATFFFDWIGEGKDRTEGHEKNLSCLWFVYWCIKPDWYIKPFKKFSKLILSSSKPFIGHENF